MVTSVWNHLFLLHKIHFEVGKVFHWYAFFIFIWDQESKYCNWLKILPNFIASLKRLQVTLTIVAMAWGKLSDRSFILYSIVPPDSSVFKNSSGSYAHVPWPQIKLLIAITIAYYWHTYMHSNIIMTWYNYNNYDCIWNLHV